MWLLSCHALQPALVYCMHTKLKINKKLKQNKFQRYKNLTNGVIVCEKNEVIRRLRYVPVKNR